MLQDYEFLCGLHYLWGIETTWFNIFKIYRVLDYITYEGLRHSVSFNICVSSECGLHYLWGIETSPMKFQLEDFFYGLHYLWGIETNQFHDRCLLSVKTFWITLPMRDWDWDSPRLAIPSFVNGLHYLWGIETCNFMQK